MEFTVGLVKLPAIHDYIGILILLIVILFLTALWNLWKTGKGYANLPSDYATCFVGAYEYLTNKTGSLPFTAVIFQKLDNIAKRFEKEGMVHIWCLHHTLIVVDEEAVKAFATDEACADKSPEYQIMAEGFGEGLVTSNGETWKKDRKLLNPVFHIGNLKAQLPIFNENAKILVKKLAQVVDKPVVDLLPFLEYCAFHNVCESLFGVNVKDRVSEMEIKNFFDLLDRLQTYMVSRWIFPPLIGKLHRLFTPFGWKNMKLYKEGKQFVLKGTDTVHYTMMWCLYMLGLHQDVQKEAYDEIQSVSEEFITYENICQLEYTECIIKETLRLYPTIPLFARHLKKDFQCGKHIVPKNTTIVFFLYRLQRNPERYPDPEKFDPNRFRSSNAENRKWAFLPFSEGHRSCIGKKFAMMQMKVTLAYILRNYEITSLDRREDLDLNWNFVLLPTRRLRMRIKQRK